MELFTPKFLSDERWYVGSAAITDGRGGSDVENLDGTHGRHIATTAKGSGDQWVVNGHKLWPTNSGGLADVFSVFCTTDPEGGDEAFAIIYVPSDTPGVTQGGTYRKAGMSGDSNSDVWFDDVRVPVEYRAHGPHEDALAARAFICSGNVGTAAQCIGVMRGLYELVRDWCDTRVVGGKVLKEHTITAGVLADIAPGDLRLLPDRSWRTPTPVRGPLASASPSAHRPPCPLPPMSGRPRPLPSRITRSQADQ